MSDTTLLVRRAGSEDWMALKAIRLEALRDTPDAYGSTLLAALAFPQDRWRAMIEEQCYFLVERDGAVLGMAAGGFHDDHPGQHWLYAMYVTPAARGGHVASCLVDAVVAWARSDGALALHLDVTTSLPRARAFYEKAGFRETGVARRMYRDPTITLITMRRAVDNA